jgi:hypothetical protein
LGIRYVVAFARAPSAAPDITYSAGSCDLVAVTRGGHNVATLANDAAFTAAYSKVLNLPG